MTLYDFSSPDARVIDPSSIRDIRPQVLDASGRLQVLPAAFWASTTVEERALFGSQTGTYGFPTIELVARLREIIAGRSAIEIGAGHGVLAEALGIPATDSFQQRMPKYRALYELQGLTTVPYGPRVIDMHASRAVRHYKPEVVVACWCTHKYDPKDPDRGGNEIGVDELDVIRHCETYIFIGNERVHRHSAVWKRPHAIEFPSFVYSRAFNGSGRDFIAIVQGSKKA
jgi:hypothetical protein